LDLARMKAMAIDLKNNRIDEDLLKINREA